MKKQNKHKLNLIPPTEKLRRQVLEQFKELLNKETLEKDWQSFFNQNPFIFSDTLNIKFSGLFKQIPLESGIPDYVFYRNFGNLITGDYGVIELKRPNQSIIGTYSSKIIKASRHLTIAEQQAKVHLEAIQQGKFLNSDDFFTVGNRHYAFIILGMSNEINKKCQKEIYRHQLLKLLPAGFHLYTYDELFYYFASSISPIIQLLVISEITVEQDNRVCIDKLIKALNIIYMHQDLITEIMENNGLFFFKFNNSSIWSIKHDQNVSKNTEHKHNHEYILTCYLSCLRNRVKDVYKNVNKLKKAEYHTINYPKNPEFREILSILYKEINNPNNFILSLL